jgi:hypothetical protein
MKLTGYYMTAVAKTELGITDIIVFDVKAERRAVDAVSLAGRLGLPSDCEVF